MAGLPGRFRVILVGIAGTAASIAVLACLMLGPPLFGTELGWLAFVRALCAGSLGLLLVSVPLSIASIIRRTELRTDRCWLIVGHGAAMVAAAAFVLLVITGGGA